MLSRLLRAAVLRVDVYLVIHPGRVRDIFPVKSPAEKRRLELLKDAYVKARYSLTWSISREDLEVLAQRIAVLRERTSAVCQAYIDSLSEQPAPA